ncbi:hypothetical protein [Mesorhizobium sp. GbtcB19]|uniref:hypothetical protein n=1 Tax=Mesorhizobium sp. GbtcB19 TaxID=2824764 RepID=UPI001C2FB2E6|nr:hypothetical protein [Mesorhizobium sp. GbtcB19]
MNKDPHVQCWFCGKGIEKEDKNAVEVSIQNLWSDEDDPPKQYFWLHSVCALEKLQGKGPKFELDVFTDSR